MIHLAVIPAGSACAGIDLVLPPTMGQNIDMGKFQDEVGGMIWDLPLRLFHWLLAVAVIVSIGSVKNENMFVHEKSGLTILGLLGFRLVWGVIGSHHARFVHFVKSPGEVISYIKGRFAGNRYHQPGHAPSGGYATVAILLVLSVMASLGLMANDDVLYEAPLAAWAGEFTETASFWHRRIEVLIFAIIVLHLAAIATYRFLLGQNLIPAMIHGGRDRNNAPVSWRLQVAGVLLLIGFVLLAQLLGYDSNRFY